MRSKGPKARLATTLVSATLAVGAIEAALAYPEVVHTNVTEWAYRATTLNQFSTDSLRDNLGLRGYYEALVITDDAGEESSVNLALQKGAFDEDSGLRTRMHFFDPQFNLPYTYVPGTYTSPSWATEFIGVRLDVQEYSYFDAVDQMWQGLSSTDPVVRDEMMGKAFVSLGHVVHHIQDMAQPQHTRNDNHCSKSGCGVVTGEYEPSRYEEFSIGNFNWPTSGYSVVNLPRIADYWWDSDTDDAGIELGLAEFTSRNFISVDTNFLLHGDHAEVDDHPMPRADTLQYVEVPANTVFPTADGTPIQFVRAPYSDHYLGGAARNDHLTSTVSLFRDVLADKQLSEPYAVFHETVPNIASAQRLLLPRAVGYSAGALQHFFRGKIEVTAPASNVLALRDSSKVSLGFPTLKVKLRNITPKISHTPTGLTENGAIGAGQLIAMVSFRRNPCYKPDLTGEWQLNDVWGIQCSRDTYLSSGFEWLQAKAVNLTSLSTTATEHALDFSANPIPIDAVDLYLHIYYRGVVGAETDAIAVGGVDISEPTYFTMLNNTDYFWLNGVFWTAAEIRSDPSLFEQTDFNHDGKSDFNFDPDHLNLVEVSIGSGGYNGQNLLTSGRIDAGRFARFAVLGIAGKQLWLKWTGRYERQGSLQTFTRVVVPNARQKVREPTSASVGYLVRGVRAYDLFIVYQGVSQFAATLNDVMALPWLEEANPSYFNPQPMVLKE